MGSFRETCFARRLARLRRATTGQAPAATAHGHGAARREWGLPRLSTGLLLAQAVQRAEAQHQIDGVNPHHWTVSEQLRQSA